MGIRFYTNPMSRGRVARWMLEEVGAQYETEVLEYGTTMKSPEYLAINPMGKVPAIVHDGVVVTECAAICAYLADAFPDRGLAPPPHARGSYYRWLFYFAGPVEAAVLNKALGFEVPQDKAMTSGYGPGLPQIIDVLDAWLQDHPYVAGDEFTAADVFCGSQIGWGMQFNTIEKRPAFESYFERLSQRAAYIKANELDNALLPADAN